MTPTPTPSATHEIGRPAVLTLDRESLSLRAVGRLVRDVADMAKPGITGFVVFTAAMGLWLSPGSIGTARAVLFLAATAVLVGSANTLNCWLERDVDGLMRRTRNRPLPAGRLDPWSAFALAVSQAAFALPLLAFVANRLTALLGLTALTIYVLVYTPLKRVTPRALEIGAIPGAIPPLMGWAAATGRLDPAAWALFGIMALWQLPHFVAIAIAVKDDYARGGLQVLPVARGERVARRFLFGYTILLVAVSVTPTLLGVTGAAYLMTALLLGAGFIFFALLTLGKGGVTTARRTFLYSLLYLAVLFTVLVADAG